MKKSPWLFATFGLVLAVIAASAALFAAQRAEIHRLQAGQVAEHAQMAALNSRIATLSGSGEHQVDLARLTTDTQNISERLAQAEARLSSICTDRNLTTGRAALRGAQAALGLQGVTSSSYTYYDNLLSIIDDVCGPEAIPKGA